MHHRSHIFSIDATNSDQGQLGQIFGEAQPVRSLGRAAYPLGPGGVDCAKGNVVGAHFLGLSQFFHLVVGTSNDLRGRKHAAGLGHWEVGLANVQPGRTDSSRQVGVVVNYEVRIAGQAKLLKLNGQRQYFSFVPKFISELQHLCATVQGGLGYVQRIPAIGYFRVDDYIKPANPVGLFFSQGGAQPVLHIGPVVLDYDIGLFGQRMKDFPARIRLKI